MLRHVWLFFLHFRDIFSQIHVNDGGDLFYEKLLKINFSKTSQIHWVSYTQTHTHIFKEGAIRPRDVTQKETSTPTIMYSHYSLSTLHFNSQISKLYLTQQVYNAYFLLNYSVAKPAYLGFTLNEIKTFLGNRKTNSRNTVNNQSTHRKITLGMIKKDKNKQQAFLLYQPLLSNWKYLNPALLEESRKLNPLYPPGFLKGAGFQL